MIEQYNILDYNPDNFNIHKINKNIIESYKFRTDNSKDISIKLLKCAEKIHRYNTIIQLLNILLDFNKASELEKGIFEFSLLHVVTNNLEHKMVHSIYHDKVYDITFNLTDKTNKTLKKSIINGILAPFAVAFLSPQQLNPERWTDILNKKKFMEDKENNMAVTDRYKCVKCGEKKSKVTELQIRSADEPTSLFVTCLVCYNTFII